MQFHPTALRVDGPRDGFLITEAVRGEGALLLDLAGERFVDELAPRDQVALAIEAELGRSGELAVMLDMRGVDVARFPNISAALAEVGLDPARDLIPVAPAAHYTMGGIAADLDGRSSLPGLYAVGECACTGIHGANRLASNSLAECFVFGRRAAQAALGDPELPGGARRPEPAGPALPGAETRAALWRDAGLERDPSRLRELLADPSLWPASSPPRHSRGRRAAAPTSAPTTRTRTPASTTCIPWWESAPSRASSDGNDQRHPGARAVHRVHDSAGVRGGGDHRARARTALRAGSRPPRSPPSARTRRR